MQGNPMKIGFLLVRRNSPKEGAVRPFVNWVKGSVNQFESYVYLFECDEELERSFRSTRSNALCTDKISEIVNDIRYNEVSLLIGDDRYPTLKVLNYVKRKTGIKTCVYVQILYGIHSISRVFSSDCLTLGEKLKFKLSSLIPFKLLTRNYTHMLKKHDVIIANSKFTATFLDLLYDVGVDGVVYPPIDTELFKPALASCSSKSVTLYVGSHAGDTPLSFTDAVVRNALRLGYDVNIFGNAYIASTIKGKYPEVNYRKDPEDKELAELYSRSIITICPQRWEQFGYVPVESMACGTPVLAFDCMGFQETIINGKTGWRAKNKQEFLKILDNVLGGKEKHVDKSFIMKYVEKKFSINKSVKDLRRVLEDD